MGEDLRGLLSVVRVALMLGLTFIFMTTTTAGQEPLIDKDTAGLFADYPQDADLYYFVSSHRNMKWIEKGKLILYATWFLDGKPRVGMQCMVSEKGAANTARLVHNRALQDARWKQLTEAQFEALKGFVRALPEGAKSPPLRDLLILSFRDGGKWVTRTYDKRKSLEELRGIYELTDCADWFTRR